VCNQHFGVSSVCDGAQILRNMPEKKGKLMTRNGEKGYK
jgi:hypothetical protein